MDMNIDVAYLFLGGQSPEADSDTAISRHEVSRGRAKANTGLDHADLKLAEEPPARISDHGKEQCTPAPMSSSDRYAAAYSASGRNSLRLSTASYSTLGDDMTTFGEIAASRDKRKLRGACEDQYKTVNAYGVRPPETHLCPSGPPSVSHTPPATAPSSMTLTDRGPDDMLQVAELQQKLEVSGAWAYELERDVADLEVEVEGLRDVCVQLQRTLDCKSQELAEAQMANHKLRKHLASVDAVFNQHVALNSHPYGSVPPPSSGRSAQEYQAVSAYQKQMLGSASAPSLPNTAFVAPESADARPPMALAAAPGAYPILTPLRTSLSSPSMHGPGPPPVVLEAVRPAAAYPPSGSAPRSSISSVSTRCPSLRPDSQQ